MKYVLWTWLLLWVGVVAVAFVAVPAWETSDSGCRGQWFCMSGTERFFLALLFSFAWWLVGLVAIFGARELVDRYRRRGR